MKTNIWRCEHFVEYPTKAFFLLFVNTIVFGLFKAICSRREKVVWCTKCTTQYTTNQPAVSQQIDMKIDSIMHAHGNEREKKRTL